MTKIFDDIFAYVHPMDANCNVFAFKDGNSFDLIDSGVALKPILKWLINEMYKDGLNISNLRNIIHCHAHPDHIQADRFFQNYARKKNGTGRKNDNNNRVNVFVPKLDLFRFSPGFSIHTSNFAELKRYFPNYYLSDSIGSYIILSIMGKTLLKYPIPQNIKTYEDGQKLQVGKYTARVYQTGGHTQGHSFLHIDNDLNIVVNSDATCINEYTSDFAKLLQAFQTLESLNPDNLLGGHNPLYLGRKRTIEDIKGSRKRIDNMLKPIILHFKPKTIINLSDSAYRRVNWFHRIGFINAWAHMTIFTIGKIFQSLNLGKLILRKPRSNINYLPKNQNGRDKDLLMLFEVSDDSNYSDKIEAIRNMYFEKGQSQTTLLYSFLKEMNRF